MSGLAAPREFTSSAAQSVRLSDKHEFVKYYNSGISNVISVKLTHLQSHFRHNMSIKSSSLWAPRNNIASSGSCLSFNSLLPGHDRDFCGYAHIQDGTASFAIPGAFHTPYQCCGGLEPERDAAVLGRNHLPGRRPNSQLKA